MRLPGEDELRNLIRTDLATEFQVASDLLDIGTGIFRKTILPIPKEEMDHFEAWMCLGILAKACRQYRGVVTLAEIALGDVADLLCRMLGETMLGAKFLMLPTLTLKQGGKPLPEVPGYPLTTAFRTKLYMAHDAASTLKTLREMAKHWDIGPGDTDRILALAERHAKEDAGEIGEEWARRQKSKASYSGLSVLDLAESIDMPFLYHTFYRPASAGIHGTDARKFVEPEECPDGGITFRACSSDEKVTESLIFSSLLMLEILNVTNQRFSLSLDERLSKIGPRVQVMARRLPN